MNKYPRKVFQLLYLIIFSFSLAILFRTFFIDIYIVPSNSMKSELHSGDHVLINKIKYGTKIPRNADGIPMIGKLFANENDKFNFEDHLALPGWGKLERGNVVVFASLKNKKEFFIKRIIGMPGDTLEINNSDVYINKIKLKERASYTFEYINNNTLNNSLSKIIYRANSEMKKKSKNLQAYERRILKNRIPYNDSQIINYPAFWTRDFFGPVVVPKKGVSIKLTTDNYLVYRNIIEKVENKKISFESNSSIKYTFQNDYYFVMGDNRHSSQDSRVFGFVPKRNIEGKLIYKY